METLSKGTNLKIGTVTGQHSFANEQVGLVGNAESSDRGTLEGGSSRIDILICTPGRLIDHLEGTPHFTLQHLRFLESFVLALLFFFFL
jgi:ATP-dependent RNA helicase DDX51/DBP6